MLCALRRSSYYLIFMKELLGNLEHNTIYIYMVVDALQIKIIPNGEESSASAAFPEGKAQFLNDNFCSASPEERRSFQDISTKYIHIS